VGLLLSAICLLYVVTALPIGWLTDRFNASPFGAARLRGIMLGGWALALVAVGLLWPGSGHGVSHGASPLAIPPEMARGSLYLVVPALGISAALIIIPALPDLQRGIGADDDAGRATMCALWNAAYSGGHAAGPLAAMGTYASLGWPWIIFGGAGACALGMLALLMPPLCTARHDRVVKSDAEQLPA
jgi:MFS family permease